MFKVFKYLRSKEESQKDVVDSPLQADDSMTEPKKDFVEEQYLSFDQLLEMESNKLEQTIFKMKFSDLETGTGTGLNIQQQYQFIQFRVKDYEKGDQKMKLLQIIDVTSYILYTEFKAKNQFTSLINACVSHELRNPLNSIISKNIEKSALYLQLQIKLQQMSEKSQSI